LGGLTLRGEDQKIGLKAGAEKKGENEPEGKRHKTWPKKRSAARTNGVARAYRRGLLQSTPGPLIMRIKEWEGGKSNAGKKREPESAEG